MRMYGLVFVILLLLVILPDYYFFRKINKNPAHKKFALLSLIPAVLFVLFFSFLLLFGRSISDYKITYIFMWINYVFLLLYVPKMLYLIVRALRKLMRRIFPKYEFWFMSVVAWVVAAFSFSIFLIGAVVTPHNFELSKVDVVINNLPSAFDGYKMVQISDIHLGSFGGNVQRLQPIVPIINQQNADLVIFTGDMVNNYAAETTGWEGLFQSLQAKDAKYAILGNHDYGDYSDWESETAKMANRLAIDRNIEKMGFQLLLNEHVHLTRQGDTLVLAGVENWGKPPFPKYGDLNKAMQDVAVTDCVILLSHDPSHWQAEVLDYPNIKLTLAGHTHAAQFMFRWMGRNVSPSSWVYELWDGLYTQGHQHLYINRGLGYVGLPMRVGARPQISVITLRSGK